MCVLGYEFVCERDRQYKYMKKCIILLMAKIKLKLKLQHLPVSTIIINIFLAQKTQHRSRTDTEKLTRKNNKLF